MEKPIKPIALQSRNSYPYFAWHRFILGFLLIQLMTSNIIMHIPPYDKNSLKYFPFKGKAMPARLIFHKLFEGCALVL